MTNENKYWVAECTKCHAIIGNNHECNNKKITMTNEKELRESLGKEIMTEIDFLCDHWVTNDNKAPYTFGGWRGEVQEKLVDIYLSKLHSHTKEVVEKIKEELDLSCVDDRLLGRTDEYLEGYNTSTERWRAKRDDLLASLEDNKKA